MLSLFGDIKSRRMFGGYGIYKNGIITGIIVDNELYFKTDEITALDYKSKNSFPFTYDSKGKIVQLSYWNVPDDVIEDKNLLEEWFNKAWQVSLNSKNRKNK
jgi:DNA transformation protein